MRARSRSKDRESGGSLELAPINIARFEDDDVSIDSIDLELTRISNKYKRRIDEKKKFTRMTALLATAVVILCLVTFAISNSAHHSEKFKSKILSKEAPKHPAFGLMRSRYVSTHQAIIHIYKHEKTQAEFMAYVPADETQDKVFGISFRTKPTDDSGVAHIIEHSVLSGSKKYPVKDPFLVLMKGSLNTFLNAMTYNDRTVFPVASRNKKDFFNLMSVYLDAVFEPKCVTDEGDWVLKQEGWRYDFDEDDKMEIKGVVYNEMKGVFSNPHSLLDRETDRILFPDNTYHFDSGGEPESISTLTQDEFVDFYSRHYHPTNSKSFVSGTVEDILEAMDLLASYMDGYEYNATIKEDSKIQFQKMKFSTPLSHSLPYAVQKIDDHKGQDMFAITWLLNDSQISLKVLLGLYVLDYLLVGTNSSPLQKLLAESGLGTSVIGNGLSTGLLQNTFAIGLEGVKSSDVHVLEEKLLDILTNIAGDGFENNDIEAAMNSIEFQLREVHAGTDPLGINIFLNALTTWNYDMLPEDAIIYEDALLDLKKVVKSQGSEFFQRMIKVYLLKNNHRVHMHLRPSESLEAEMVQNEEKKVKAYRNTLTIDQLQAIRSQTERLNIIQNTDDVQEFVDTIPSLTLADINRSGVEYDIGVVENVFGSATTLTTNIIEGSSGIVYIDIGVDLSTLSYFDVELLPFVVSMLNENDTMTKSRSMIDREIGMHTGGINIELELLPLYDSSNEDYIASDNKHMRSLLFFRAKCTKFKVKETLELIKDVATKSIPVSREKAIQILERKIANYQSNMSSNGHSYAMRRIHARYDTMAFLTENLYGINQFKALKRMLYSAKQEWNKFQERLKNVIGSFSHMRSAETVINLTGDLSTLQYVNESIEDFVKSLDNENMRLFFDVDHPWMAFAVDQMSTNHVIVNEGISISSQVSYVGEGGMLFNKGEKVAGGSCVPIQFLKKGYLWETVRAKNGAYGVMA